MGNKMTEEQMKRRISKLEAQLRNANEKFALISTMRIPEDPEKAIESLSIIKKHAERFIKFEGFPSMSIKRRYDAMEK